MKHHIGVMDMKNKRNIILQEGEQQVEKWVLLTELVQAQKNSNLEYDDYY